MQKHTTSKICLQHAVYIIGNWCKQRATLWATVHGRPYTPGTSYDESLDSAFVCQVVCYLRCSRSCVNQEYTTSKIFQEIMIF